VGCTLHYIDAGIDTGRLIAHISPEVRAGDSELVLFWRAVQDSAAVYAEAVERIARGEALGTQQPGKGRLYQVRDRGLRHEKALDANLAAGMLRDIALPRRVRWFSRETSGQKT
jgi:methionyl-tRNA formyltransferase